jgi:hypothetical protein
MAGQRGLAGRHAATAVVEQASMVRRSGHGEAKTRHVMEVGNDGRAYDAFYRARDAKMRGRRGVTQASGVDGASMVAGGFGRGNIPVGRGDDGVKADRCGR